MLRRVGPLLSLLFLPLDGRAGGFEFPDNGVRALGRGGAFVVRADDPTAIYHNPSGITRIKQPTLLLDVNVSHVAYGFEREPTRRRTRAGAEVRVPEDGVFDRVNNAAPPFPAPFLAYVHPLGDFAVGGGIYGPSAYGWRDFPADGPQRYELIKSEILLTFATLTMGWKGFDGRLRLGVSLQAASVPKIHIELATDGDPGILTLPRQSDYVQTEDPRWDNKSVLDLSRGFMPTGIVGLTAAPTDWLEFGLSYRPGFALRADGKVSVHYSKFFIYDTNPDDPTQYNREREAECADKGRQERYECSRDPRMTDDGAHLSFNFPHVVKAGVRYVDRLGEGPDAPERFDVELDVIWEGWSTLDDMTVAFDGELEFNPFFASKVKSTVPLKDRPIVIPHDWLDVISVRLGGDWRATEELTLRAGATWESSTFRKNAVDLLADGFPRTTAALGASYALGESLRLSLGGTVSFAEPFQSTDSRVAAQIPMSDCVPPFDDDAVCAFDGEPTGNPIGDGIYTSRIVIVGLGLTAGF